MELLSKIQVKNYRCIGDLTFEPNKINVLFGPNGIGKTTFLDVLEFMRDFFEFDIDRALSKRNYGKDLVNLNSISDEGNNIFISITINNTEYKLDLKANHNIITNTFADSLKNLKNNEKIFKTSFGKEFGRYGDNGNLGTKFFRNTQFTSTINTFLHVQSKFTNEAKQILDTILSSYSFNSINFLVNNIKKAGSDSTHEHILNYNAKNLLAVLRNLKELDFEDKRKHPNYNSRYDTIMKFMMNAFPDILNILYEQTTPQTVYAAFYFKNIRDKIYLSSISDGMLQLLILITSLFFMEPNKTGILMYDEPETSLHPWAIAVFAMAVKEAAYNWNKQIFISTHSPVLISQFEKDELVECTLDEKGSTKMKKLSEYGEGEEIRELLDEFSAGNLYMSENIGGQSTNE